MMTREYVRDFLGNVAKGLSLPAPTLVFHELPRRGDERATSSLPFDDQKTIEFWPPFFETKPHYQMRILMAHTRQMMAVARWI